MLASEANTKTLCRMPVVGVLVASVIRTAESGLVGFVKGIVESVGSTVLLGVPAIAAAEERSRAGQTETAGKDVQLHYCLYSVRVLECFPANTRCLKKLIKSVSSSYIRSTFSKKNAWASSALVMSILCSLHVYLEL